MVRVEIRPDHIRVTGHAITGAPPGMNVICAAVSAITLTLIRGLEDVAEEMFSSTVESGNVCINWQRLSDRGNLLVDTWFLGICGIREAYGHIEYE